MRPIWESKRKPSPIKSRIVRDMNYNTLIVIDHMLR